MGQKYLAIIEMWPEETGVAMGKLAQLQANCDKNLCLLLNANVQLAICSSRHELLLDVIEFGTQLTTLRSFSRTL